MQCLDNAGGLHVLPRVPPSPPYAQSRRVCDGFSANKKSPEKKLVRPLYTRQVDIRSLMNPHCILFGEQTAHGRSGSSILSVPCNRTPILFRSEVDSALRNLSFMRLTITEGGGGDGDGSIGGGEGEGAGGLGGDGGGGKGGGRRGLPAGVDGGGEGGLGLGGGGKGVGGGGGGSGEKASIDVVT